jgi:hypothetical protein
VPTPVNFIPSLLANRLHCFRAQTYHKACYVDVIALSTMSLTCNQASLVVPHHGEESGW